MKFTSRFALAAALGFSVAVTGLAAPAFAAKKDEKAAKPEVKLSEAARKELLPAQDAMAKQDFVGAQTHLDAANAVATTPDDKFYVGSMTYNLGIVQKDEAKKCLGVERMVGSGKVAADELSKMQVVLGHCAYDAKDMAKAEQNFTAALASGSTDMDAYARLADAQSRLGKPALALATLQKLFDMKPGASGAIPSDWYARGVDIATRAQLMPEFVKVSQAWISAYPSAKTWHDVLITYHMTFKLSPDVDVDLFRLIRAANALPQASQSTYLEYALAVYGKYPGEAVAILNEGLKAGKLSKTSSKDINEVLDISNGKIPSDKASLPAAVTAAKGPKATFKSVETTGDVFYGYGESAKAIEMYKLALTKPGADLGMGNVRLGAALFQAGDKEGARAAFATVTSGPYAPIAGYWTLLLDHPAVG